MVTINNVAADEKSGSDVAEHTQMSTAEPGAMDENQSCPLYNHELFELEILEHVKDSCRLTNRLLTAKLGCSVKLTHTLLTRMVEKGFLQVVKHHSRRWDYFLTPQGIAEKARLTCEFFSFSMRFYQDARRRSAQVCRDLAESGHKDIAFLGDSELAEIVYLGVREWGLNLLEVYGRNRDRFMGCPVCDPKELHSSKADAVIVCEYDKAQPMLKQYFPDDLPKPDNLHWIFNE